MATSRIDRRIHRGNWCNQSGAGIGYRPQANPTVGGSTYQAFVWVKPPGESDGSSSLIPTGPDNPDGKGFDRMCDPTYGGNSLNGNKPTSALAGAPVSGRWFQAQFVELVQNAYPPFGTGPVASNTPMPPTNTPLPSNTPGGPTATRTNTAIPSNTPLPSITPIPSNTPSAGGIVVDVKGNGTDNNQQSGFAYRVRNTGTSAVSNIAVRIYFTTDGSNAASAYVLEKYYDQSGSATVSAPVLASGSTYYFTVTYTASLAAGQSWEYQGSLHLNNWGSTYNSGNDYWHTGYAVGALPAAYTSTTSIPAFSGSTLIWGTLP